MFSHCKKLIEWNLSQEWVPPHCLVNIIMKLKYRNQEVNFNVLFPGMGKKNPRNSGLPYYVVSFIWVCAMPKRRANNCWDLAGHSAMFVFTEPLPDSFLPFLLSLTGSLLNLRRSNLQCLNSFFLSAWLCGPFLFKLHSYFSSNDY